MRYRKQTATGDYTLTGSGNDYYVNNAAAVAQAIQTGLTLFQGDWFGDTSAGMPWRTDVLGKYTKNDYDMAIKSQILATTGVLSITSYSSTYDPAARKLTVSASAESIYGPVDVETTL
jgi:hypothetical protein